MSNSIRQTIDERSPGCGVATAIAILEQAPRHQLEQEAVREYIETMALELSRLAKQQDSEFLAYLLTMAVAEARAA